MFFNISCVNYSEIEISDASQYHNILLLSESPNPNRYKMELSGNTDGDFTLLLMQSRYPVDKKDTLSTFFVKKGIIDTVFWDDWYGDTLFLSYLPHNVQNGSLKIKYIIK